MTTTTTPIQNIQVGGLPAPDCQHRTSGTYFGLPLPDEIHHTTLTPATSLPPLLHICIETMYRLYKSACELRPDIHNLEDHQVDELVYEELGSCHPHHDQVALAAAYREFIYARMKHNTNPSGHTKPVCKGLTPITDANAFPNSEPLAHCILNCVMEDEVVHCEDPPYVPIAVSASSTYVMTDVTVDTNTFDEILSSYWDQSLASINA